MHTIFASLGFPLWLRLTHFINLLFIGLLIRSGIQILAAHPRLYWKEGSNPAHQWLKFTTTKVPMDKLYTSMDDENAVTPIIALPGGDNLGLGRPGIASMAIAAVDAALWDLKARLLDVALVTLLGAVRKAAPIYGSGGFTSYSREQLQKQLGGWVAEGIPRVKWYFRRMLEAGAVDVLQADATRCAGITGFLRVGALVESRSMQLSSHCGPSLHVHPCCAVNNFRRMEYFHDHVRIERMFFDGVLISMHGELRPDLSRPGMGLEFKRQDAARYAV